jgi:hypothetical protein
LAFSAFRNDRPIGSHTLTFHAAGNNLAVDIDVRFAVGFGPITLYRYTMQGTERWVDGQFAGLETVTNDNGTAHHIVVRRDGNQLLAQSANGIGWTLPVSSLPLTHWTVAAMSAGLFNPQDGKPILDQVQPLGLDTLRLADGSSVRAESYHLTGELALQDWYDRTGLWLALRAKAKDGSVIDYRRL